MAADSFCIGVLSLLTLLVLTLLCISSTFTAGLSLVLSAQVACFQSLLSASDQHVRYSVISVFLQAELRCNAGHLIPER